MKVYNCFQFYNELDILEIRLQEGWDSTDIFVITESNFTHSGNPKPYYMLDNWERFKPYESKIRRIQIDESIEEQRQQFPNHSDEWVREKYQRWSLEKGLYDLDPTDLIIISDLDEVPRSQVIEMIKEDENDYDRYILNIPHFHFRFNYMRTDPQVSFSNIIVVRARAFTNTMSEREYTFPWFTPPANTVFLEHGGWHFTDFGNDEHVITKLKSFCHLDQNNPEIINKINIDWLIENRYDRDLSFTKKFDIVELDDYFPDCITNNQERWKDMIISATEGCVTDFYPL